MNYRSLVNVIGPHSELAHCSYPLEVDKQGVSECCGSRYISEGRADLVNPGIAVWFSEEPYEDNSSEDFYVDSVKLIDGTYMNFKHNLDETFPEHGEDEE